MEKQNYKHLEEYMKKYFYGFMIKKEFLKLYKAKSEKD